MSGDGALGYCGLGFGTGMLTALVHRVCVYVCMLGRSHAGTRGLYPVLVYMYDNG